MLFSISNWLSVYKRIEAVRNKKCNRSLNSGVNALAGLLHKQEIFKSIFEFSSAAHPLSKWNHHPLAVKVGWTDLLYHLKCISLQFTM